jgi:general secretion pathway protein N
MRSLLLRLVTQPSQRMAALGLLCGALLGVLCFAPAAWLAASAQSLSGQHVRLQDPQGTLWNGSAQLVLSAASGGLEDRALPGRLHWRIRPAWLGAHIELLADCCNREHNLQLRPRWTGSGSELSINAQSFTLPADVLAGLGTPWNTLQLAGTLVLDSPSWVLRSNSQSPASSGQAQLQALNMSSPVSTLKPLGSYQLQLTGGASTDLQLSTLSGDLQLSGQGQWSGAKLRFQGMAQASAAREAALGSLLSLIGQRRGAQSVFSIG